MKRKRVGLHDLDLASHSHSNSDNDDDDSVPSLPDSSSTSNNKAVATSKKGDSESSWLAKFEELKQFRKLHGNFLVPQSDRNLGSWVNTVRQQYKLYMSGKKSYITHDKIDLLNNIGFVWEASTNKWMLKFEELCRYKQAHGDCLVPQGYKSSCGDGIYSSSDLVVVSTDIAVNKNNPKAAGQAKSNAGGALGSWVMTQRKYYRLLLEGKKSYLTQEKVDLLNGIGFVWSVRKTGDDRNHNKKKKKKVTPAQANLADGNEKVKKPRTKKQKGQGQQQRGTTMWAGGNNVANGDIADSSSDIAVATATVVANASELEEEEGNGASASASVTGKDDFVEGVKV